MGRVCWLLSGQKISSMSLSLPSNKDVEQPFLCSGLSRPEIRALSAVIVVVQRRFGTLTRCIYHPLSPSIYSGSHIYLH